MVGLAKREVRGTPLSLPWSPSYMYSMVLPNGDGPSSACPHEMGERRLMSVDSKGACQGGAAAAAVRGGGGGGQ